VVGTTPEYFEVRALTTVKGTPFGPDDVGAAARVIVLGQTAADKLFGAQTEPLGRTLRLRSVPFQVVGVLARKGQSPMGSDYDDVAIVPVSAFQTKIQGGLQKFIAGAILVSAISASDTGRAQREIAAILRDRHHLAAATEDDFSIRNLTEIAAAQQQGTRALTGLLAAIAFVSLLVGGIGIMNIMLVSVTERTREIGLRMAVGAKPWHVLSQFLVEATTLSMVGGLIGTALGLLAARLVAARFGWPFSPRLDMVFVAFGFSAIVGIAFGLHPARKAAKLDPIEALRYE
jgi:putative ABC transport system permease protein